jgi:hypothetical protein
MPKNKVSDPITDQEIAFARLVLSGATTDRHAAVQQQLVQQEVDGQRRLNPDREQVLDRLWEIANLSPDMTRGSITGQVKALSMIVAMQNFLPDRRAASSEKKSPPAPAPQIYAAAWRRGQQATTTDPPPSNAPAPQEDGPGVPKPSPGSAGEAPPDAGLSQSTFANPSSPSETPPSAPYAPAFSWVPDTRVGFSIKKNPFAHPR